MSLFTRKIKQIEQRAEQSSNTNLAKATSEKAVDVIKELSGVQHAKGKKIIDNVIVFTNAAGGTGASTLAHNVAFEASRKKLKVILVDLNILCPVQHAYLGIKQGLEKPDLVSFLLGKNSLNQSIDNSNEINLIYANNRTLNDEINCNTKIAIENLNVMLKTLREYYDIVIVDCPMKIDEMLPNVMLYSCDSIYMVWDEGIGSTINTEKLRRNMASVGIDSFTKLRVILNKRTDVHFSDYAFNKLNLELVEVLPFTTDIIDNSLRGRIFCEAGSTTTKNSSEFARKVQVLTDKILKIGGYVE